MPPAVTSSCSSGSTTMWLPRGLRFVAMNIPSLLVLPYQPTEMSGQPAILAVCL